MTQFQTYSQEQTEAFGSRIAAMLKAGDIVAFTGDLGAGKTALARGILRALDYEGPIASPTFTIVNEYRSGKLDAAHFDMYRIDSEESLYSTGFYDYLDGRFLLLIEWSEHIPWALDGRAIRIAVSGAGDQPRTITVEGLAL